MNKIQISSSKLQKNSKFQAPNTEPQGLGFGPWSLFGVWDLKFGALGSLWCVLLVMAFSGSLLSAQTNVAKAASRSHRYLLVVETSHSMERRSEGVLGVVQGLLVSGMSGQLRRGDTLGIWTFNEELHAGEFPLERWSPDTQKPTAAHILTFLQKQKYDKQANLQKVLPALARLTKDSGLITVILISAGEDKIVGTPYDEKINEAFKLWRDQQRKAKMPVVTVLRGKAGKVTDYTVTAAPWPVEIPALEPEKKIAETVPPKTEPAPQKAQPAPVPPLIITGKKVGPAQNPKPTDSTAPKSELSLSVAVADRRKVQGVPAPESPDTAATSSVPVKIEPPALVPDVAKIELKAPVSEKPLADIEKSKPAAVVEPPRIELVRAREATSTETIVAPNIKPPEPAATPIANAPVNEAEPANTSPKSSVASESRNLITPTPSLSDGEKEKTKGFAKSSAAVQPALTARPESFFRQMSFWALGVVVSAIFLSVIVLLMRRPRTTPPVSLITRSLDRGSE